MSLVEIKNLSVEIEGKLVLKNVSLEMNTNSINVFLGPNGAGKSTIANVLMGNPKYKIVSGEIFFDGKDITNQSPDLRAKEGLFLSFQNSYEIDGVTMLNFLRTSYNLLKGKEMQLREFIKILEEKMSFLEMDKSFRARELNVGFSGGEKKRSEMLQLLLYEPKFAILDELDSGLDVDALKLIKKVILELKEKNKTGFMIITHNNKVLEFVEPDNVFVLINGEIKKKGGKELILEVEKQGFKSEK